MNVLQNKVRSTSRYVKILMYSVINASIIHYLFERAYKFNTRKTLANKWSMMAGSFLTACKAKLKSNLIIQNSNYNIIFGHDSLWELGIHLDFQNNFDSWKETKIPMKSINYKMRTKFVIPESKNIKNANNRIKKILDANYEKANLEEITTKFKYLNSEKQVLLYMLSKKHENIFFDIQKIILVLNIKMGAQSYHAKLFPIPKAHEGTLKTEINKLVSIGVLKRKNNSEWAAPIFTIPKKD